MRDESQIDLLANYIMSEVPGEPSQNEGAGDTAIRLLKQYRVLLDAVNGYRMAHSRRESGEQGVNINDPYVDMLIAADVFDPRVK